MGLLLEVRDLTVRFGDAVAVDGVSFAVRAGETLGLVGESGSGKSVTSLAVLRLLAPGATVSGADFVSRRAICWRCRSGRCGGERGREIAMIFQEPMTALNPVMTVGEQIAEAVRAHHPKLGRAEVRERVLAALDEVALPDPVRRYGDYPHQFSGGQRQRILIAMAVVNKPALLIADEPTTALDVTVQAQILELLRRLREVHGLAMLFISHDLAVTAQVADRVAVMQNGGSLRRTRRRRCFVRRSTRTRSGCCWPRPRCGRTGLCRWRRCGRPVVAWKGCGEGWR